MSTNVPADHEYRNEFGKDYCSRCGLPPEQHEQPAEITADKVRCMMEREHHDCGFMDQVAFAFLRLAEQPAESAPAQLAARFHAIYERLAPSFGYETREDTREFNPTSANGRLMTAVCEEILGMTKVQPCSEPEPCPLHPRLLQPAESAPTSERRVNVPCDECSAQAMVRYCDDHFVAQLDGDIAAAEARGYERAKAESTLKNKD